MLSPDRIRCACSTCPCSLLFFSWLSSAHELKSHLFMLVCTLNSFCSLCRACSHFVLFILTTNCSEGTVHFLPYSLEIAQQSQHEYITIATTVNDTWGCANGTAYCCSSDDQHTAVTRASEDDLVETDHCLTQWCFKVLKGVDGGRRQDKHQERPFYIMALTHVLRKHNDALSVLLVPKVFN